MNTQQLVKKIKKIKWDNRVQRPGFLQSKQIINEAEIQPNQLTKKIQVIWNNIFWIKESNLYDDNQSRKFYPYFKKAFQEDPNWPKKIANQLERHKKNIQVFKKTNQKDWSNISSKNKINQFKKYISLLMNIQKYYSIAVPLTNYCERKLLKSKSDLVNKYSYPLYPLDMDSINKSLSRIRKVYKSGKSIKQLVNAHIKKYVWIKTAYNIINPYTYKEVLNSIKQDTGFHHRGSLSKIEKKYLPYVIGLQTGIYLRNRMKEMSQQVWYAYESLGLSLAKDLALKRDDFMQLTPTEVIKSIALGKSIVNTKKLKARNNGFAIGILNKNEYILTGKVVDELYKYYNKKPAKKIKKIKGTVACLGKVQGRVKIVKHHQDFKKLNNGEILLTSMTTPDFVPIMKKAAAIITDEGGLSCHAAIVSREMNIPCVIGTKIATRVFKDGDKVEVDAVKGVITKL